MDRLTTMATFLRVVKNANFTSAAEELGISRTLVSRQIADLEGHLGLKLLNRTTRSVTVTEAGMSYAELCQRVLSEIRSGEEEIAAIKNAVEGDIAILCPIWVGSFGISRAAAEFAQIHPGVALRIQFAEPSANPHEFLSHGYDVCIQPNTLRDSSIKVRKIGAIDHKLVASPDYCRRAGHPAGVADLVGHACLAKLAETGWSFANGERHGLRSPARFSSNSVFALREAAECGLGIAMLPYTVIRQSLDQGLLVEVLADCPVAQRPLYVAYPPGGDTPRKTRALISFLADWFRQHPA